MSSPRRKLDQTTTYLTGEQVDKLKLLADRKGTSMSALIREGLDMVLEKHKEKPDGGDV